MPRYMRLLRYPDGSARDANAKADTPINATANTKTYTKPNLTADGDTNYKW